jgi:hypothetical protein
MRFSSLLFTLCTFSLNTQVRALLEEKFVDINGGVGSLNIAEATIFVDADDYVGVHIALKSLVNDFEQITGKRPALQNITANSTGTAAGSGIIVGSVDSRLIRQLSVQSLVNVSDVEGRWEVFKTAVVENPIVGLEKALVIVGSDKRGTIFGIHTLAEQSGQSP